MGTSANYPKVPYEAGKDTGILQPDRVADKVVEVRRNLPGNIIVIHGVNDVGVGFGSVEQGLCEGLQARLKRKFSPASYSIPKSEDKNKLYDDPDAVFFKRRIDQHTDSPVIPFYWGYREVDGKYKSRNGQQIDRYGNRLDKDLSKGGGPFANATNTLPDMWNRGFSALPGDMVDFVARDPVRPVLKAPGRMYMVLAAQRLAALISMIRDYAPGDAVSIVAHSQGCLISLLAQAFLLEKNLRPADTLVLTHPPYSLIDDVPFQVDGADFFKGGKDAAMENGYASLAGRQNFHARLQTLVNIVDGLVKARCTTPEFRTLDDNNKHFGMVGGEWVADKDRDNRGKVYLYFCPEDMTVALNSMQGIGWQGIPDEMEGSQVVETLTYPFVFSPPVPKQTVKTVKRYPLKELGAGFFQRVFTAKRRPDPKNGTAVPVGLPPPHDFVLRVKGEDDHAHVADGGATQRIHLESGKASNRAGIRTITGEALIPPVPADMYAGGVNLPGQPTGAHEETDPIDSAIAVTSDYGLQEKWFLLNEPTDRPFGSHLPLARRADTGIRYSPARQTYDGYVIESSYKRAEVKEELNRGKPPTQCREVVQVFTCVKGYGKVIPIGKVLAKCLETPDEARLRWQNSTSPRSFHGAIFSSRANHANVTAYDVAIGGGKASSHPKFHAYLCAVADWRVKKPTDENERVRPSILSWEKFVTNHATYWNAEPNWRKKIIEGNMRYYSTGTLPDCLPVLPNGLPSTVVCETTAGRHINPVQGGKG